MTRSDIVNPGRRDVLKTAAGLSLGVALPAWAQGRPGNGPARSRQPDPVKEVPRWRFPFVRTVTSRR
jgi:hypothetical protein